MSRHGLGCDKAQLWQRNPGRDFSGYHLPQLHDASNSTGKGKQHPHPSVCSPSSRRVKRPSCGNCLKVSKQITPLVSNRTIAHISCLMNLKGRSNNRYRYKQKDLDNCEIVRRVTIDRQKLGKNKLKTQRLIIFPRKPVTPHSRFVKVCECS